MKEAADTLPEAGQRRKVGILGINPAVPADQPPVPGRRAQVQAKANLDVVLRNEYDKMHKVEKPKRAVKEPKRPSVGRRS